MSVQGHTARFCITNSMRVAGTTVTASSAVTSLPAANITNPWRTKVWRATGKSDEYVQFTLPSAQPVTQVAIFNHNLTSAATVTILAATNSSFSPTAVTTSGLTYNSGVLLHHFATTQSYQYWRIRVQDSGNSNNVELGFAFLGTHVDFDYRPGFSLKPIHPAIVKRSWDNQKTTYQKSQYRAVGFNIGDAQDISKLDNIIDTIGYGKNFVLILDPGNNAFDEITDGYWRFTFYGSLSSWENEHRIRGVFNTPVGFEEAT